MCSEDHSYVEGIEGERTGGGTEEPGGEGLEGYGQGEPGRKDEREERVVSPVWSTRSNDAYQTGPSLRKHGCRISTEHIPYF